MKTVKMIVASFAVLALLVTPAAAQAPFNADFTFNSAAGPSDYDFYQGKLNGGDFFQIFCVQPYQYVSNGEVYSNAWVTPLNTVDFSHAVNGTGVGGGFANAPTQYANAARLASLMTPGFYNDTDMHNLQYAIWEAMGFTVSGFSGYNATIIGNFNGLASGLDPVTLSSWAVITDTNGTRQEFLYQLPETPQEVVPEPATMTLMAMGLVGLAATRKKRRS